MLKDLDFGIGTVLWGPVGNTGEKVCWQSDVATVVAVFWIFFKRSVLLSIFG